MLGICVNDLGRLEEYLGEIGANLVLQIFVRGPTQFKDTEACARRDLLIGRHVIVHSAFVSNPWGRARGSLFNIGIELRHAKYIGARGYILHLAAGMYGDSSQFEAGMEQGDILRVVMAYLGKQEKVPIYFEINSCHASERSFETPDKIHALFDKLEPLAAEYGVEIGLCIDTAHLFACGISWSRYGDAREWLEALRPMRVMFHLNDSHEPFASGRDRHAGLCKGNIWGDYPAGESGIRAVVEYAARHSCVIILEQSFEIAIEGIALLTGAFPKSFIVE